MIDHRWSIIVHSIIRSSIVVYASSNLLTEPSGPDVRFEERTGPELLAERLVQVLQDAEPRIESHQIDELEGPHRVVQPELQRLVDVPGRRDTFLQHVERL